MLDLIQVDLSIPVTKGLTACLSPDELAKARSFHFDHLQRRYLVAHAALRNVMSSYLTRAPSELSFVKNEWGKPSVPGGPHFNLSHSDDLAVIVVDLERETGIDLETGSLALSGDEMTHVLSPDELAERRERDLADADHLQLWVRKEAVLKSLGKGVAYDPSRLTVGFHSLDFNRWREVSTIDDGARHDFHLLDVRLGAMSCAVARRDEPLPAGAIAFRSWSPESEAY